MKKYNRLQAAPKILGSMLLILLHLLVQAQNPRGIITIKAGVVLNIGKNATLITNSDINNSGTLTNAGSLILNGDALQSFPGTAGSVPLMTVLEVKNTGAGITLNQGIKIYKELKLTTGNLALGNYDITIQSNAVQTAAVSAIGAGAAVSYGTGRFVVERFINIGSGGHAKSWQFLSVPANGQTIKNSWQEAGAATVGYGTQVTNPLGVAAGYDLATAGSSIKTYVSATNTFSQGPSSTSALIDNAKGYMLFVRGDRTVTSGSGTTPTILRIKGTLFTPGSPPSTCNIGSDKYESVGNPYASQIDFTQLTKTGGVDNVFYKWDPSLAGTYGIGSYQTISATNSWIPVPGGGNYTGVHKTIESGQAFFVHTTAVPGTISFTENVKTGGSKLLNRTAIETGLTTNRQFIRSTLLTNIGSIADGNAAAFDIDLSNAVNSDDAFKIMNGGENFCLKRDNYYLAVEGRSLIGAADTLFYFMNHLLQQAYTIVIAPENMDLSKDAWLVDNFLQTQRVLSLSDSNFINFNVTNDPLSSSTDRFMLVFRAQAVLGLSATTMSALRNVDGTIAISWATANENDIREYIVEKSANGRVFNTISSKNALLNNGSGVNYAINDALPFEGNNFYRIKIISFAGNTKYSNVVMVSPLKNVSGIAVYPNPVMGKTLHFYFTNQSFGGYQISIINEVGQQLWTGKILYNNNSAGKITVELPQNIVKGNYHLKLIDKDGKSFQIPVMLL